MLDETLLRQNLQALLSQLDWSTGIAKEMVLEHLAGEPVTQRTIARALANGVYFSPADVLAALPAGAWSEPPPAPRTSSERRPVRARETARVALSFDLSNSESERTTTAIAIGAGVMALAGVMVWLGRRLLRR